MKNIAIFLPTLKKGGAEKQAALLAQVLCQHNKVLFILLYSNLGLEDELLTLIAKENIELVKLKGFLLSKLVQLYRLLRKKQIDTLFCYLTQPDLWGSIIGKLAGVKRVFQGVRNCELPKSKVLIEKIASYFSNGIVVNSYSAKESFRGSLRGNMYVIPNCYINIKPFLQRDEKQIVTITTVGRFVKQKDYRTALESVARLKRNFATFKYQIVGYGEMESQIRDWIEALGLTDNVEVLINPRNIPAILDQSDIYLSTSLFEGTSNSIMEAMDASLPIVATNVGDNNVMVEDGKNGFLTPIGDIDNLADSLLRIASNHQLRIDMGRKSNEILREKYSLEKFRDNYLKLIK